MGMRDVDLNLAAEDRNRMDATIQELNMIREYGRRCAALLTELVEQGREGLALARETRAEYQESRAAYEAAVAAKRPVVDPPSPALQDLAGRCATCRWWEHAQGLGMTCGRAHSYEDCVAVPGTLAYADSKGAEARLVTAGSFGCVMHQSREEAPDA